ncbi:MAG: type IV secretory system conjugative DNA transfer family protein, partial [Acetobacteraceae bacterium]
MRKLATIRLAALLVFCLASFTVVASLIFLTGTGLIGDFAHPFWQWWLYLFEMRGNPTVHHWLIASGIPAAALPLAAGFAGLIRGRRVHGWTLLRDHPAAKPVADPIRSPTDNHGHARWMTLDEARELWPGPDPKFGGVVVGEAYAAREDAVAGVRFRPNDPKTWGQGGKAPLLIDPCDHGPTHSLVIAGSGSYKTTSAVSTLLMWTGSTVVLDPSTELGPMLRAAREAMGHRVFELNPRTAGEVGFNVLDWIDITSPMADADVAAVVDWVCGAVRGTDSNAEFFNKRGKALVTCLLAHMLWDESLALEHKT